MREGNGIAGFACCAGNCEEKVGTGAGPFAFTGVEAWNGFAPDAILRPDVGVLARFCGAKLGAFPEACVGRAEGV